MKEKWYGKNKRIIPLKFKEACGEYNKDFANNYQQDADDFFNFLVNYLHEDTNLKQTFNAPSNNESIDTNAFDLGNEYWANNFRNMLAYFMGYF